MTSPLAAAGAKANLCLHDVSDVADSIYTVAPGFVTELAERLEQEGVSDRIRFYFDDGYASVSSVAALLRERHPRLEVVLALTVSWLDQPGRVTWDQVRSLYQHGVRIAGHGTEHRDLAALAQAADGTEAVLHQLRETRTALAEFTPDEFVLPYGAYDQAVLDINREHNLYSYITTIDYAWDRGQSLRPRLMITSELTPARVCETLRSDG